MQPPPSCETSSDTVCKHHRARVKKIDHASGPPIAKNKKKQHNNSRTVQTVYWLQIPHCLKVIGSSCVSRAPTPYFLCLGGLQPPTSCVWEGSSPLVPVFGRAPAP